MLLQRPAHSGWLQGVVTGIGLHLVYSPSAALAVVQPDDQNVQRDKPLDGSSGEAPS